MSAQKRKREDAVDAVTSPGLAHTAARVGFIGVGTIATATVHGLCSHPDEAQRPASVVLSPRSAKNAASLAASYPSLVTVAADNQSVIDAADWIVVAVLPKQIDAVLSSLKFRADQTIVSFVATTPVAELARLCGRAATDANVVKAIPLPPVATRAGVTPVYPPHTHVTQLFNTLGRAVVCETEASLVTCLCTSGMMGMFYQLNYCVADWMRRHGASDSVAAVFTAETFKSIASDSVEKAHSDGIAGFTALVDEQTVGGLNEGVIRALTQAGAYTAVSAAMDATLARIQAASAPKEASTATDVEESASKKQK